MWVSNYDVFKRLYAYQFNYKSYYCSITPNLDRTLAYSVALSLESLDLTWDFFAQNCHDITSANLKIHIKNK